LQRGTDGGILPGQSARGQFERRAQGMHRGGSPLRGIPRAVVAQQRQVFLQANGETGHRVRVGPEREMGLEVMQCQHAQLAGGTLHAPADADQLGVRRQPALVERDRGGADLGHARTAPVGDGLEVGRLFLQPEQVHDVVTARLDAAAAAEAGDAARIEIDLGQHERRLDVVAAIVGAFGAGQPERIDLQGQQATGAQVFDRMLGERAPDHEVLHVDAVQRSQLVARRLERRPLVAFEIEGEGAWPKRLRLEAQRHQNLDPQIDGRSLAGQCASVPCSACAVWPAGVGTASTRAARHCRTDRAARGRRRFDSARGLARAHEAVPGRGAAAWIPRVAVVGCDRVRDMRLTMRLLYRTARPRRMALRTECTP
jgi:hypothetical protein